MNLTLSFWEANDGFTFEKVIDTTESIIECQVNIWYINFLDSWVTTDSDGVFYFWDLLHHKVVSSHHISGEPQNTVIPEKNGEGRRDYLDHKESRISERKKSEGPRDYNPLGNLRDPKVPIDLIGPTDSVHTNNSQGFKGTNEKDRNNAGKNRIRENSISKDRSNSNNRTNMKLEVDKANQLTPGQAFGKMSDLKEGPKGVSFVEKTDNSMISKSNRTMDVHKNSVVSRQDRFNSKLKIVHYLLEITEISYINLLALASTDKHIRIWDVNDVTKPKIIFCLNLIKGGVHKMRYLGAFQVMVVAGYENSIPVFNITPKYYDVNVVGRLVGHVSIVTALEVMEGTPMILSADDTGCIKTWDIRSFQCYQTIEMSHKTIIGQLLSMENLNKVAFIGCRVNYIEFDRSDKLTQKQEVKHQIPIKAEVNLATEELLVCTNSDLKFLDLNTGRLKRIYGHMISEDSPDEISVFRMIQKNHRFLLGDPKGDITIFGVTNGDKLLKIESHGLQVVDVKVDTYNKLLVSAGGDSQIIIQRERIDEPKKQTQKSVYEDDEEVVDIGLLSPEEIIKKIHKEDRQERKNQFKSKIGSLPGGPNSGSNNQKSAKSEQFEVLRTITNAHKKAGITCIALSVYHNLLASASIDNMVYLYDYEYGKFIIGVELEAGSSVTALEFINGLGILIICSNNGYSYLLSVINKVGKQEFSLLGTIQMRITNDISVSKPSMNQLTKTNIQSLKELPSARSNEGKTTPVSIGEIQSKPILYAERIYVALSLKGEHKDLEDFRKIQTAESENLLLNNCEVYFGLQNGYISIYQFTSFFQGFKIVKHSNTRLNYNPFRTNLEDCNEFGLHNKNVFKLGLERIDQAKKLDSSMTRSFYGHKGGFTSIALIKLPEEYLLTTGHDKYVKIISKYGDCLAAWNVNHPLPLKWGLRVDTNQDMKNKVLFALKVIQAIFKRYYNLLYSEGKVFDLKGFLKEYQDGEALEENGSMQPGSLAEGNIFQLTQVQGVETGKKVRLMADEYLAKDFAQGKLHDLYSQELLGPSLKMLDTKRRLLLVQEEWVQEEKRSEEFQITLAKKEEAKKVVRRNSEDGFEHENYAAYIEKAKKLNVNKSERVMKLHYEFRKVDHNKGKEPKKDMKAIKHQGTIVLDSVVTASRPTMKGTVGVLSRQNTTFQGSSIEKQPKARSKVDFYKFAEKRQLLHNHNYSSIMDQKEVSVDSTQARLQKELDNCIDFTEEGRIKRIQKATREVIKEKSDFSQIMQNINGQLKRSQVKNLNSRKSSLPSLKSSQHSQAYNPFQSVLPPVGKKHTSSKSSKYSLVK